MLGRLILRVGLLTLAFSTTLLSETIPFDYWYGRIVGASRYSLELVDSRRELAEYRVSLGVGSRNKYQFYNPDRYLYTPHRSSNKLRGSNRGLNFIARLPLHARYDFTLASLDNSTDRRSTASREETVDLDMYEFTHGLQLWSSDSLSYSTATAPFLLLNGPFCSTGQFHLHVNNHILHENRKNDLTRYDSYESGSYSQVSHFASSANETDFDVSAAIGLSGNLQVELRGQRYQDKRSSHSPSIEIRIYPGEADIDTTHRLSSSYLDNRDRAGAIKFTRLWPPQVWSSLSYQYVHKSFYSDRFQHDSYSGTSGQGLDERRNIDATGEYTHEVIGTLTWLSRRQQIERQLLLDNYSKYYGLELERGTFVLNSELRWYRQRKNYREADFAGVDNYELSDIRSVRHRYELEIAADLGYYVRTNFSTGAKLRIYRQAQEQSLNYETFFNNKQLNSLTYWLEFRTYRWQADKRREISWDQVSPLDYILGPLLRPLDLRLRLDATPPALERLYDTRTGHAWRFRLGSFNRDWQMTMAGAVGLPHHCEVGSSFNYRYYRSVWTSDALTRYTYQDWDTSLKWQPLRFARLTVLYKWSYSRQADDKYYPRGPLEASNWTVSVKAEYIR